MADIVVTSVIQIVRTVPKSKPYVCSTKFGLETLGTNGVPKKLFLVFLLRVPDFGLHFPNDLGLIPSNILCCKCVSQMS